MTDPRKAVEDAREAGRWAQQEVRDLPIAVSFILVCGTLAGAIYTFIPGDRPVAILLGLVLLYGAASTAINYARAKTILASPSPHEIAPKPDQSDKGEQS